MEGIPISSILILLFVIIVPVGLIGVGAFLFVRQSLDRILDRDSDTFEPRVLSELEALRVRLDRISEKLDVPTGQELRRPGDNAVSPTGQELRRPEDFPGHLPPSSSEEAEPEER